MNEPTLETFTAQINQHYPELTINEARLLTTDGQFSYVVIVNEEWVFRFPCSDYVADDLRREIGILKKLATRLHYPIPNPKYVADDPKTGKLAFMGYRMIAGRPLSRAEFKAIDDEKVLMRNAHDISGILKVLHDLPLDFFEPNPKVDGTRESWREMYAEFQDKLFPFMRPDAQAQVRHDFEKALNDDSLWAFEPVICHGDLGTGNILFYGIRLCGIIDWTTCGAGDPAQDVGALLVSFGWTFIERVFGFYPELRETLRRVDFIKSTYALQQALYALRDGNQADFDDGMQDYI